MENEITKRHVQVPNDMTEQNSYLKPGDILIYATIKRHMNKETKTCYPSLTTISQESGASVNTVKASIQNLVNSKYITVSKKGRGNLYTFLKWDEFEPFSYSFLDNKNLTFKEKAYILSAQQYMFKKEDTQDGIITYDNVELSKRLNISPTTISRLNDSLTIKKFLKINTLSQRNPETGLPIKEKVFHLSKIEQAIVFILKNHEERIKETEDKVKDNSNEISLLKERIAELEEMVMRKKF